MNLNQAKIEIDKLRSQPTGPGLVKLWKETDRLYRTGQIDEQTAFDAMSFSQAERESIRQRRAEAAETLAMFEGVQDDNATAS